MNNRKWIVILFTLLVGQLSAQTLIYQENFEDTLNFTFEANRFSTGSGDFSEIYSRSPGGFTPIILPSEGSNMWVFEDVDNAAANPLQPSDSGAYLVFNAQDISSYDTVQIIISLGSDSAQDYETSDSLHIEYAFDGDTATAGASNVNTGTYTKVGAFYGDCKDKSSSYFCVDAGLDGHTRNDDSTVRLTNIMTDYTYKFATNGATKVSIRVNLDIDGGEEVAVDNLRLYGIGGNTAPTISVNTGLSLNENATSSITVSKLKAIDSEEADENLTFTITSATVNGQLENTDNAGISISSFTQKNIVDGKIQYVHNGSNTISDSLVFTISDGNTSLTNQNFSITVNAVDDDTPTIVANNNLVLNEGATASISLALLKSDDTDSDNSSLTYTVTTASSNGQLENTDNIGVSISTFTQQNVTDGKIQYVHSGGNTTSDSFIFKVADGTPNELAAQTFSITVNAVDDDTPTIVTNNSLILNEGATAFIPLALLESNDTDSDNSTLTYTVTTASSNGQLENTDNAGVLIATFTQQNLTDGKIQYVHNGGNTTSDGFTFKVADGTPNELVGQAFSITVNAVDDDVPTIVTNKNLKLDEGATASIPLDSLEANDTDSDNSTLTYTVTTAPSNGQLENTDNAGVSISTFTQQNLVDGKIQYVHDDGNTTSDSFTFKVADGTPNELVSQTFSITVNAVDDETVTIKTSLSTGGLISLEYLQQGKIVLNLNKEDIVSVQLFNMQGSLLPSPLVHEFNSNSNLLSVDINKLDKGIFLLKVQVGKSWKAFTFNKN